MGTFDRRTGTLFLMDMDDLSRSVTIKAESGGKPWGDAIPLGPYRILEHPSDGFFRLEPEDSDWGNDEYDSSTDPDNGRGLFRLHHPGNTTGCIAAADIGEWDLLEHLLDETRRGRTPVLSKRKLGRFLPGAAIEWLDDYGTLDVIESAPPVVVPPTLHPSAAGSWISYV
jgi:hypothetical protein